jgi:hypothetical protein
MPPNLYSAFSSSPCVSPSFLFNFSHHLSRTPLLPFRSYSTFPFLFCLSFPFSGFLKLSCLPFISLSFPFLPFLPFPLSSAFSPSSVFPNILPSLPLPVFLFPSCSAFPIIFPVVLFCLSVPLLPFPSSSALPFLFRLSLPPLLPSPLNLPFPSSSAFPFLFYLPFLVCLFVPPLPFLFFSDFSPDFRLTLYTHIFTFSLSFYVCSFPSSYLIPFLFCLSLSISAIPFLFCLSFLSLPFRALPLVTFSSSSDFSTDYCVTLFIQHFLPRRLFPYIVLISFPSSSAFPLLFCLSVPLQPFRALPLLPFPISSAFPFLFWLQEYCYGRVMFLKPASPPFCSVYTVYILPYFWGRFFNLFAGF